MRLVAIHVAMIPYHDTNLIVNGRVSMFMFQCRLVVKRATVSRRGRDTLIPLRDGYSSPDFDNGEISSKSNFGRSVMPTLDI